MARQYVMQTWVKHDDNHPNVVPDLVGDYSGEQIGNRKRSSVQVKPGYLANGQADIASCDDPRERIKADPTYSIHPAIKTIGEYEAKLASLDEALRENRITERQYDVAVKVLDVKLDKAYRAIKKLDDYVFMDDEPNEADSTYVPFPEDEIVSEELSLQSEVYAIYCYENGII